MSRRKLRSSGPAVRDLSAEVDVLEIRRVWSLDNAVVTMHLSGRAQTRMFERAAERFLRNLSAFRAGGALESEVDLARGY